MTLKVERIKFIHRWAPAYGDLDLHKYTIPEIIRDVIKILKKSNKTSLLIIKFVRVRIPLESNVYDDALKISTVELKDSLAIYVSLQSGNVLIKFDPFRYRPIIQKIVNKVIKLLKKEKYIFTEMRIIGDIDYTRLNTS